MFTNAGFALALVKGCECIDFQLTDSFAVSGTSAFLWERHWLNERRSYIGSILEAPDTRLAFKRESRLMGVSYDALPLHWSNRRLRRYCSNIVFRTYAIGDNGMSVSLQIGHVLLIGLMRRERSNRTSRTYVDVSSILLYRRKGSRHGLYLKQAQSVLAEKVEELNLLLR
jgi:hypothetical protein